MKWTTSWASAASNDVGDGSCSALACARRRRVPVAGGGDERCRGVDGGNRFGAEPRDQLGGEGAGAAADIEHPLPGRTRPARRVWADSSRDSGP